MAGPEKQPAEQPTGPDAAFARLEYLEKCMHQQENINAEIGASLNTIMAKLNDLPLPEGPSPEQPTEPTAPIEAIVGTRTKESRLKPSPPTDFDGDRTKGQTFLNQCELYFHLCSNDFDTEVTKINWTLSFMKTG